VVASLKSDGGKSETQWRQALCGVAHEAHSRSPVSDWIVFFVLA
jgi:hypothetical protein